MSEDSAVKIQKANLVSWGVMLILSAVTWGNITTRVSNSEAVAEKHEKILDKFEARLDSLEKRSYEQNELTRDALQRIEHQGDRLIEVLKTQS